MVKRTFTLIELIMVIVILGLIAVGSFKAIQMLYERYYQVNVITRFSILSQTLSDQMGTILYNRIPITVIGYDPDNGDFKKLSDVDDDKYKIFEWMSGAYDAKLRTGLKGIGYGYTGFIDLDASNRDDRILVAKDFNITDVNNTLVNVFNIHQDLNKTVAIIFAGDRDNGAQGSDYNNSYGWHGFQHKKVYVIQKFTQVNNDANLSMTSDIDGNRIFSKFYLPSSAWAIALARDVNLSAGCMVNLEKNSKVNDNTLLLFYNYRPWNNETFCADKHQDNSETKEGNVSILAQDVTSFKVKAVDYHIEFKVQFSKPLYRGSDRNITITKQKVVF